MTIDARVSSVSAGTSHGRKSTGFRTDIQGLRTVAVGLVLVFHAGAPFLPGGFVGVDVFFVISGFLITGILLKEVERTKSISLLDFYARRVKRILPAASAVVLVVGGLTAAILPRTRWEDIGWEMLGSSTYSVNWTLANSVNYLNSEVPAGPLQHFWSLAVEEQFYVIWPILLVVLVFLARPGSGFVGKRVAAGLDAARWRMLAGASITGLTAASLAWSIHFTLHSPGPAYFVTTTRLWEIGIGAMVAVFAVALVKIPRFVTRPLGWAGLLAIVLAGALYSVTTSFPGYAALLPTLGTAAILIAGLNGHDRRGVAVLLATRPMTWIGDRSYSLYLWHWPLIVFGTFLLDGLEFYQGVLIVVISCIPALLSYRYLEVPFQRLAAFRGNSLRAVQVGGVMMLVTIVAGFSLLLIPKVATALEQPALPVTAPLLGAELLAVDPAVGVAVDSVASFTPSVIDAEDDTPDLYQDGCHQEVGEDGITPCVYGDADSEFTIALVGDSHAAHWAPALVRLAHENGWRLETYTKSSCPLIGTAIVLGEGTDAFLPCVSWNQKMMANLTGANGPDFVLMSGTEYTAYTGDAISGVAVGLISDGYTLAWSHLRDAAVPFAFIEDTPRSGIDTPECVSQNENHLTKCATSAEQSWKNGSVNQREASEQSGDRLIDLGQDICPDDPCAAIVGKVLVYRDSHHLTATYARTLAPAMGEQLRRYPSIPFTAPLGD